MTQEPTSSPAPVLPPRLRFPRPGHATLRSPRVWAGGLLALTLLAALTIALRSTGAPAADPNVIATDALLHDSRDPFYRTPASAVPTGQPVVLRLRTAAQGASSVTLYLWNSTANGGKGAQQSLPARRTLTHGSFDYWQVTIPAQPGPRMLRYKWRVTSPNGHAVVWYEDHFDRVAIACDPIGGAGQIFHDTEPDCGYHLNVYAAGFDVPDWIKHAVIYQIFVDRFYDGFSGNDGLVQPLRYDTNGCFDRFGNPAPAGYFLHATWNEEPVTPPQGCDFYGGDLQGVLARLDYLHDLGVTALYLNPIFMADSNHKYDTTDYLMIDPHFGNLALWRQLAARAHALGMHIILDGVFNHTSSDSLYFDRYHTWQSAGADETQSSRYESWYQFTQWPSYNGWFGFDSLPQLAETQPIKDFIFAGDPNFVQDAGDAAIRARYGETPLTVAPGQNAVATYWLGQGADGWRLDAADQKSDDWWRQFRAAVKAMDPQAVMMGEYWGDAGEYLLGDQQDGTMNYRFRRAVLGFFAGGGIDPDTGHDSGLPYTATQFDAHLQTVLEAYPLPAVYASMNLVDSHDVGRILWELGDTPDATAAQIAQAKQTLRLIVQLQMTWIGAPTIYYGDEAGQTQQTYGATKVDPGDRLTFPWDHQDTALEVWYRQWIAVRAANPVLQTGAETTLLADDAAHVFAYARHDASGLAVVVLNADAPDKAHTVTLRLPGVPDGTQLTDAATQAALTIHNHTLVVPVGGDSGRVLLASGSFSTAFAPVAGLAAQDTALPAYGAIADLARSARRDERIL